MPASYWMTSAKLTAAGCMAAGFIPIQVFYLRPRQLITGQSLVYLCWPLTFDCNNGVHWPCADGGCCHRNSVPPRWARRPLLMRSRDGSIAGIPIVPVGSIREWELEYYSSSVEVEKNMVEMEWNENKYVFLVAVYSSSGKDSGLEILPIVWSWQREAMGITDGTGREVGIKPG